MEENGTKSLYNSYLVEAEKQYPSQSSIAWAFTSPEQIKAKYSDYLEIQEKFRKPFNYNDNDMANLNESPLQSKEDYLNDTKAMSFLIGNIDNYKKANKSSSYFSLIGDNISYLQNLQKEDRQAYYDNKISELQKRTLKLINVNNSEGFSTIIDSMKINDDVEAGMYTSEEEPMVEEYEGKRDVSLGDVGKGALAGAAAGAGIGSLFSPIGTAIGAGVGALIGAGTELLDMFSENELIEGFNNSKRNFVSAMYGSTIGMVGDAAAGIGNVINTGISAITNEDIDDVEKYNPLNVLEGVTDGMDDFLISKQKDEYTGFSKFLVQDLSSVGGSIAGFAVTGNLMGKAFGAKEIKFGNGILNTFLGGSKAELATRTMVALSAMDGTFDTLKDKGATNEKALMGSFVTGGLNWGVLAFTKAIPGTITKNAVADNSGKYVAKAILKSLPMEMATEAVEEMGELMSEELGKSLGMGQAEFSSVKDYLYTGFLGAIGGAIGAGMGGINYRNAINTTYDDLAKFNPEMINDIKEKHMAAGLNELESKDKAIGELMDDGLDNIPQSILNNVLLDEKDKFVEAVNSTKEYVQSNLRKEAMEIAAQTTDMDSSEKNLNKIMFLLNESNTNADKDIRTDIEDNITLYARVVDPKDLNVVHKMSKEQKAEMKTLSQSQFNNRITEINESGANDFYVKLNDSIKYDRNVMELLKSFKLNKADVDTMYEKQLITPSIYADFNNKYDKEMLVVDNSMENYLENPTKKNKTYLNNLFPSKKDLYNYVKENYSKDKVQYISMLEDFGLQKFDDSFSRIISTSKDIDKVMDFEVKEQDLQNSANKLQEIKTLKSELKDEYGKLSRVPFELLNKISDNDISLEKLNEMESLLKQQIAKDKQETDQKIAKEPIKEIKSKGVLSITSKKSYYDSKVNEEVTISDKLREVYYNELSVKAGNFDNISSDLKNKYNLNDFNDMIVQMTLDQRVIIKSPLSLEKRLSGDELLNAKDTIETLKDVDAKIDSKGYVTIYHRTDKKSYDAIMLQKSMIAKEDGVFFSTNESGQADSFGESIVELNVPVEDVEIDDLFDDEAHVRISLQSKYDRLNIENYEIVSEDPTLQDEPQTKINDKIVIPTTAINPFEYIKGTISKEIQDNTNYNKMEKEAHGNFKIVKVEDLTKVMHIDRETELQYLDYDIERMIDLVNKMRTNGINYPVTVTYDATNGKVILGEGNHRLMIAKWFGIENLPVRFDKGYVSDTDNGVFAEAKQGLDIDKIKEGIFDNIITESKPITFEMRDSSEYFNTTIQTLKEKIVKYNETLEYVKTNEYLEGLKLFEGYGNSKLSIEEQQQDSIERYEEDIYQAERDLKNLELEKRSKKPFKKLSREQVQNKVINRFSDQLIPMESDKYIVKDSFSDMDVMGVGVDYQNGYRTGVKIYYNGDQVSSHTFFYDKEALIKEMYKMNFAKTLVEDNGQTIKCGG